jgi:hypothetical protein
MASSFTWLDYSEQERRKMLDVIHLFQEKDTRDELGIGTVRDAFADILFPGTSTIQRRARYFLFIPWMYLNLEKRGVASGVVGRRSRDEELALIEVLVRSDDASGVIGERARRNLKRLPSNIYWQGLGRWGIRLFPGSQEQYFRSLDAFYSSAERPRRNDDGEPSDGEVSRNWHPGIPPPPKEFPRNVSLGITATEAKYLRERILTHASQTMLAFLVSEGALAEPVAFPWEHPQLKEFPAHVREQLEHARHFSEAIHGAALLYNLMLAEDVGHENLIEQYRDWLRDWSSALAARRTELLGWERSRFWEIVASGNQRVTHSTRSFIDAWLDLLLPAVGTDEVITDVRARRLIHGRERQLKRGLARLDNARARELWNGQAGTAQLDYRWSVAQTIVEDILTALSVRETHA